MALEAQGWCCAHLEAQERSWAHQWGGQPFFRLPSFFNLFATLEKNENSSLDARQRGRTLENMNKKEAGM